MDESETAHGELQLAQRSLLLCVCGANLQQQPRKLLHMQNRRFPGPQGV